MGFYGNITSTASTQFSFDITYPNRLTMERNASDDGIAINRFVLIEYDTAWIDPENYIKTTNNPMGEITPENDWTNYDYNFNIDLKKYANRRGYDSTVWQKIFDDKGFRYMMVAELNSVVPTFDVIPVAPSEVPLTPKFDEISTNLYYKLQWQAPWGFRIKESDDNNLSDISTKHTKYTYNSDNQSYKTEDINVKGAIFFNKNAFDPQVIKEGEERVKPINGRVTVDKNQKALVNEIKLTPGISGKVYDINPNDEDRTLKTAEDVQELTINLPAIGNMMSDAWDIIHGPLRNDDMRQWDEKGNNVSSLQGRLDSIDALNKSTIPYKTSDTGALVGAKLTDDNSWIEATLNDSKKELNIKHINNKLMVKNQISSIDLNAAGKTETLTFNNPIRDEVGHIIGYDEQTFTLPKKFNKVTTDNGSLSAKNQTDTLNILSEDDWLETKIADDAVKIKHTGSVSDKGKTEINLESVDSFTIPMFSIDQTGHIKEKINNQYNLPYSFKSFAVNKTTVSPQKIKDTLNIESDPSLEPSLNQSNGKTIFKISHKDQGTKIADKVVNPNNSNETSFQYFNPTDIDSAGHVANYNLNTVYFPYGYSKIKTVEQNDSTAHLDDSIEKEISATTPFDTLAIGGGNKWITATTSDNKVVIGHAVPTIDIMNMGSVSLYNGDTFITSDVRTDEAGHVSSMVKATCQLPFNFNQIKFKPYAVSSQENLQPILIKANEFESMFGIEATSLIDITVTDNIFKFNHGISNNATKQISGSVEGQQINIPTIHYDDTGHIISTTNNIFNVPFGANITVKSSSNVDTWEQFYPSELMIENGDYVTFEKTKQGFSINHNMPNKTNSDFTLGTVGNPFGETELNTGSTFYIPYLTYDEYGHITGSQNYKFKLANNPIEVLPTEYSDYVKDCFAIQNLKYEIDSNNKGTIIPQYKAISSFKLSGYYTPTLSESTSIQWDKEIDNNDTINSAFGKLYYQLHNGFRISANKVGLYLPEEDTESYNGYIPILPSPTANSNDEFNIAIESTDDVRQAIKKLELGIRYLASRHDRHTEALLFGSAHFQ